MPFYIGFGEVVTMARSPMVNSLVVYFDISGSMGERDIRGAPVSKTPGEMGVTGLGAFSIKKITSEPAVLSRRDAGLMVIEGMLTADLGGNVTDTYVSVNTFDEQPSEEISSRFALVNPLTGTPCAKGRRAAVKLGEKFIPSDTYDKESLEYEQRFHAATVDNPIPSANPVYLDLETKIQVSDYVIPACFEREMDDRKLGSSALLADYHARKGKWRGFRATNLHAIAAHASLNAAKYPQLKYEDLTVQDIRDVFLFVTDDDNTIKGHGDRVRTHLKLTRPYARNIVPIVIVVKIAPTESKTTTFSDEADFKFLITAPDQISTVINQLKVTLKIIDTWTELRTIKNANKENAILLTRPNGTQLYIPPMSTISLFAAPYETISTTTVGSEAKITVPREFTAAATTEVSHTEVKADLSAATTAQAHTHKNTKRYVSGRSRVPP
ncbi:MAG: hypothetical protein Harvfovirus2_84 [Harvfovirus sp.]|uniref:Uncharacterized protein n=1 Tax=Harvfovirus sp. TaxID=2487768 RepID=A0A3G5A223_9VIRU|nr:MAG: hypothetical protein Harvfovirus2_84 [Harvfovirus sp.]